MGRKFRGRVPAHQNLGKDLQGPQLGLERKNMKHGRKPSGTAAHLDPRAT